MTNYINVREVLGHNEPEPALFIKRNAPDPFEAMHRYEGTYKCYKQLNEIINETNTREIPPELAEAYEIVSNAFRLVLTNEKYIIKSLWEGVK